MQEPLSNANPPPPSGPRPTGAQGVPPMPPAQAAGEMGFVQKWLGPGATNEQAHQFLNNLFQSIITEIKKDEARAKKAYEHMKKVIEGKE